MDAARKIGQRRPLRNEQGSVLVYVAVGLVVFILIAGLAIDLGYMFVTKAELQNAADAGALAGAQKMKQAGMPHDASQSPARVAAKQIAQMNLAANSNVQLADDGTNTLSNGNDMTVGYWDSSNRTYTPGAAGTNIFNAMQVRPRRTNLSPAGPVDTFLAKIRPELHTMEAAALGIAAFPPKASNYMAICPQACGTCNYDPANPAIDPNDPSTWPAACNNVFISQPSPDPGGTNSADKFAWSSLLNPVTSSSDLVRLLQSNEPAQNVCGKEIYTTMGTLTDVLREMESNMYNPSYDGSNKSKNAAGEVTEWWVEIPVTTSCPPGAAGGFDPKLVIGYAKIRIQAICSPGGGGAAYQSGSGECLTGYSGNVIYDRIMCVDCAYSDILTGTKVNLVK